MPLPDAFARRLLVIDDEPDLRTLYELTLLREGYDIDTAGTVAEALQALGERRYGAVISDMRLPDGSGLDVLQFLETQGRPEKTIVITAYGSAENAVEALRAGAYDYLTKPVDLKQFRTVVASALAGAVAVRPASGLLDARAAGVVPPAAAVAVTAVLQGAVTDAGGMTTPVSPALGRIAGRSAAVQAVRALVAKVARSMAPVLIQGESGTGKELVARAVHEVSARAALPFIAVNCGAIPEQLLEAEFFGYRKGAFTGAAEDRAGFFQAAHGGTLFLDEIGDLPLAMQSKLLRAVQERSVRPVGAVHEAQVDVRLLSATHKDLAAEVQAGRFRQDLYYRLNVIQIRVPPLRERLEDLSAISERVLERIARDAGLAAPPRLDTPALAALAQYAFPGNVRELENLLHRAVALASQEVIGVTDLGLADPVVAFESAMSPSSTTAPSIEMPTAFAATDVDFGSRLPTNLEAHLDAVERDILVRALDEHRGNRTAAGSALGLSLRQMRYRMSRLGIGTGIGGSGSGTDPGAELARGLE